MSVKVVIMEYERGWGSRVDEVREFPCEEKAREFIEKFNSHNTEPDETDWYMKASLQGER